MKILVLGAGVIGVTTAWFLSKSGHEVTVVDRQAAPGLETSFANGGQISVSHAEPWANPSAPLKVLKWLAREDAPLLFRLRPDIRQWLWGLAFLRECTRARSRRSIEQIVTLAGTAELNGYNTELDPTRCRALLRRTEQLFPGAGDAARAQFWAGLRPATPSNVPYIGATRYPNLFLNTGHGTLGWTHACGSGRALADIVSGRVPEIDFAFCAGPDGLAAARRRQVIHREVGA